VPVKLELDTVYWPTSRDVHKSFFGSPSQFSSHWARVQDKSRVFEGKVQVKSQVSFATRIWKHAEPERKSCLCTWVGL